MLLPPLPHLPCGYTLPASSLLVKSSDELPLVGTICCHSLIFPGYIYQELGCNLPEQLQ